MSTRARIGFQHADGHITSIYTHWDGYPKHHGPILRNHYNTEGKIADLMALGNLSVLAPELGVEQNFDAPREPAFAERTMCLAYGRDRHEVDQAAIDSPNRAMFEGECRQWTAEYGYLFSGETWYQAAIPHIAKIMWLPII